MTESREIKRTLRDLRKETMKVQKGGLVLSSRRIDEYARVLAAEIDKLETECNSLIRQIAAGRADEANLREELVELRTKVAELEDDGWPIPANLMLPEDY